MASSPNLAVVAEPDDLFKALFDGIEAERLPPYGGRLWTAAVKKILRKIANELDPLAAVYASDVGGEFMLDFVCIRPARPDPYSNGPMTLAVESEWGGADAVWQDFSKLLYVRAPRKLLICSLSRKHLRESIRQFERDIADVGGLEPDERYIIIIFGDRQAECWWCEPPAPVRFRKGLQSQYSQRYPGPLISE